MSMRQMIWPYTLGTLDAANEYTAMVDSTSFRNVLFTFLAASSAACTLKFYTSDSEIPPTLASATSSTNAYQTVWVYDLGSGAFIAWDTGVIYAASSDWFHRYMINTDGQRWVGVIMTARAAWSVAITCSLTDNL